MSNNQHYPLKTYYEKIILVNKRFAAAIIIIIILKHHYTQTPENRFSCYDDCMFLLGKAGLVNSFFQLVKLS